MNFFVLVLLRVAVSFFFHFFVVVVVMFLLDSFLCNFCSVVHGSLVCGAAVSFLLLACPFVVRRVVLCNALRDLTYELAMNFHSVVVFFFFGFCIFEYTICIP